MASALLLSVAEMRMCRWIVGVGALSLWAVCGGEVASAADAGHLAAPSKLETGCWAADIDLPEGECLTAHAHIARALSSCWSKGGEAVSFAVKNACATGYRHATVSCCPALSNATPPPAALPNAFGADGPAHSYGSCVKTSGTSNQRTTCIGGLSINEDITHLVATAAEEGQELRSFNYSDRCSDHGFATSAYSTCAAGNRPE